MEHHLPLIGRSPLFANIDAADLAPMLQCLGARKRTFPKGSYLFRVGDRTTAMGIMLEGSVRLEKEDYWGNRSILASFGPGQSFAEVYACEPDLAFDINVVAAEDATVLFLDIGRVTTMCPSSCAFHARLIRNLLGIVAKRTHALTRKIEHTTKRTTRAKLLSYLSDQAEAAHASRFVIPFDRQELADYLKALEPEEWHNEQEKIRQLMPYKLPAKLVEYLKTGPLRLEFPERELVKWAELYSFMDVQEMTWKRKKLLSLMVQMDNYSDYLLLWSPRDKKLWYLDIEHEEFHPLAKWDDFIADPGRYLNGMIEGEFEK